MFLIKVIWERSKRLYGSPKITAQLRKMGWKIGKNRIVKLMKISQIKSIVKRKYRICFSKKNKNEMKSNLLNRNFNVSRKNKVWVSDITYIKVCNKWRYLSIILDLYSRKVVGWNFSKKIING